MDILIKNGTILTPFRKIKGDIFIEGERIKRIYKHPEETFSKDIMKIDARDMYVSPGFIDVHTHGAGGYDISDGRVESFVGMGLWKKKMGVTTFLPTTISLPFEKIREIVSTFKELKDGGVYKKEGIPYMPGLHLEGPFLSIAQKGAQPEEYIYPPTKEISAYLVENAKYIAQISMAPEIEGVLELGYELSMRGKVVSIGHSDATFEKVVEASEYGFALITHLYSGCSGVRRINLFRVPGVIEAGLLLDHFRVEVIGDGKHLPPSLLKFIFKNKGIERVIGITDSISATGLPEGTYKLGGKEIIIEEGVAKLKDRSSFAGSVAQTNDVGKNFRELVELPVEDAIKPITVNPAELLGLYPHRGVIAPGAFADIVIFDKDFNIFYTLREGEIIYKKGDTENEN